MSRRLRRLAARRELLCARSARLRGELAADAGTLGVRFRVADRLVAVTRSSSGRLLLLGAAALLFFGRPRRLIGLAVKALALWPLLGPLLPQLRRFFAARDHGESFQMLESGRAKAFMMDDALLYGERAKAINPDDWIVVGTPMSSEVYELMKRSDEAHVVEKAHRRPRFVEDCVREMIRGVVENFPALDDRAFVSARQVNLETIHQHNVVAERFGTLGEIRREIETSEPSPSSTSRQAWLDALP